MSRRQSTYVKVDAGNPIGAAQCDRCSLWYNRNELAFQYQWAGSKLYNTGDLVCIRSCLDVPQEQLRVILIPPDPPPVLNARVPNFAYEEQTVLIAQSAIGGRQPTPNAQPPWGAGPQLILCDQSGEVPLIAQYLTSS